MLTRSIGLLILVISLSSIASQTDQNRLTSLKAEGTILRLKGHYDQADKIYEQLKTEFPDSATAHTFKLNTLLTRLSWDPFDTAYDQQIRYHADETFVICERAINKDKKNYQGYYDCGQAHFLLTYLNAFRGKYYKAGRHGSRSIKSLERVLELRPNMTDAKLHLGTAYYFADNLPYYIKAFSYVLWFVPTGNSSKSLPYVKDVTENGTFFRHVSKYFYSDLLIDGDDDDRRQATRLLQDLVTRYPENRRFYLRLISLLVERGHFKQSLIVYQQFIETKDLYNRQSQDLSLARLWAARAHLGLHDVEKALRETESVANTPWQEEFPSWGKSWFLLVRAQISDLTDKRSAAVAYYEQIIRAEPSPPTKILALAEAGLKTPFSQ